MASGNPTFRRSAGRTSPSSSSTDASATTLDLFGHEATNVCIIDVYADAKNELYLSLTMFPADAPQPAPEPFAEQVAARLNDPQSLEVISTPLWYVYAPDTTLMSLGRPGIEVRPAAP